MKVRSNIIVIAASLQLMAVAQTYKPGDFQSANANYPQRNPFYFEGRIDWDMLKIDQPSSAWEYAQRGIHKQDDLEDIAGAVADYQKAVSLNSLTNGTCQLISSAPVGFGQNTNPPPCMFTVRLRLANLLRRSDPVQAISLLGEVTMIDPLRLGVNALIGATYAGMADSATTNSDRVRLLNQAIGAYQTELKLSPVTAARQKLTGDDANNAHVHWALAAIYRKLVQMSSEMTELNLYLKATKWHSDTYPWRIQLAQQRIRNLQQAMAEDASRRRP